MTRSKAIWTPEIDRRLRQLWAEGITRAKIGAEIGKPPAAVTYRAKQLGLIAQSRAESALAGEQETTLPECLVIRAHALDALVVVGRSDGLATAAKYTRYQRRAGSVSALYLRVPDAELEEMLRADEVERAARAKELRQRKAREQYEASAVAG